MKNTIEDIYIYSKGPVCCSVCVPRDMEINMVEKLVNMKNPTGIKTNWKISTDKFFKDGVHEHPYKCDEAKNKIHYLMVC